jgi:uncharacterized protein with NRDE domain
MCLILFACNSHPDYSLVVATNRDEFYERDTEGVSWWSEYPNILAGRDRVDVLGCSGYVAWIY